jgi:hypothetical protein
MKCLFFVKELLGNFLLMDKSAMLLVFKVEKLLCSIRDEVCKSNISGSHSGENEDDCLLGYCTMQSGINWPAFQRCLLPLST